MKLPPYVDFREKAPPADGSYTCTCGYVGGAMGGAGSAAPSHIRCPDCGGVAVRMRGVFQSAT